MLDPGLYTFFIIASATLAIIPGPNVAFIVANSMAYGVRYGLVSVAGTSSAMVPQLIITILGASVVLAFMSEAFDVMKWIGVLYLLYLGVQNLLVKVDTLHLTPEKQVLSYRRVYWRGFFVSATNPKTLLFFGAFLPQFVSPDGGSIAMQMSILAITFIVVGTVIDSLWALLAGHLSKYLRRYAALRYKISGAFFLTAAATLSMIKKA